MITDKVIKFGNGTVLVHQLFKHNNEAYIVLIEIPKTKLGEKFDIKKLKKPTKYRALKFTNTKSIDILINNLKELKEQMESENV